MPNPYIFPPSQHWHGNDGHWSTFIIRVGTPAQDFYVLPSTTGEEILIPVVEACATNNTECGELRGVLPYEGTQSKGFLTNASSTWKGIGIFDLHLGKSDYGIDGAGKYGYETVGLSVQNSGGPTLEGQIVGGIALKEYFLGIFPLGVKPANFSTFEYPQPSYLASMKERGLIPSLSFGYTAGAFYRGSGALASLVLGGYDSSRLKSGGKTFPFGSEDSHSFTVGVQSIVAENTLQGTVSPLTHGIIASIDSTLPYMWLPEEVCERFETAFGLSYDNKTSLYLVNGTTHARLKELNPTISMTLGDGTLNNGNNTVVINLPYSAFDLQATWPIYSNATNYFPLKRASSHYTLGRTFLQEVYLSVDYERSVFNISQAHFASPMPKEKVVSVHPIDVASNPPALSTGAKVGIGAGSAAAFALLLSVLGFFFYRYKKERHVVTEDTQSDRDQLRNDSKEISSNEVFEVHDKSLPLEADGVRSQIYEMGVAGSVAEMATGRVHELST